MNKIFLIFMFLISCQKVNKSSKLSSNQYILKEINNFSCNSCILLQNNEKKLYFNIIQEFNGCNLIGNYLIEMDYDFIINEERSHSSNTIIENSQCILDFSYFYIEKEDNLLKLNLNGDVYVFEKN